jgi:hypothetical protein
VAKQGIVSDTGGYQILHRFDTAPGIEHERGEREPLAPQISTDINNVICGGWSIITEVQLATSR